MKLTPSKCPDCGGTPYCIIESMLWRTVLIADNGGGFTTGEWEAVNTEGKSEVICGDCCQAYAVEIEDEE